jgi:hypothetical protein
MGPCEPWEARRHPGLAGEVGSQQGRLPGHLKGATFWSPDPESVDRELTSP